MGELMSGKWIIWHRNKSPMDEDIIVSAAQKLNRKIKKITAENITN